jgi:glutaredoxin
MILYSTSWCGPCQDAKQIIYDKGLDVEIVDIDSVDADIPKGLRGVPTLTSDSGTHVGTEAVSYLMSL